MDSSIVDRISVLPEELLQHILSLLDAIEAVQTSLLSRSWRYIWISVSVLNFSEHLWLKDCHTVEERRKGNCRFLGFVDQVLLNGHSKLTKFCLNSNIVVRQPKRIENWISAAVGRNAQELHIKICSRRRLLIPRSLFNSPVTVFSMQIPYAQLPITSCFSEHLRKLHLVSARLPIVYPELVFSCPVLENLTIKDCYHTSLRCLSIYAPQLENLMIELNDFAYAPLRDIRLRTPKLVSFVCKGYLYEEYMLENVSSLVTADIGPIVTERLASIRLVQLLEVLEGHRNAAITLTLTLTGRMFEGYRCPSPNMMECLPNSLPFISHLKLIMERKRSCIIAGADLLKRSTYIETLAFGILDEEEDYILEYNKTDWGKQFTFECMFHRLRFVNIFNLTHGKDKLEFLEFVMRSAPVLENITITTTKVLSRNEEKLAEFTKKIHCLPRASSSVAVLFEMRLD